MLKLIIYNVVPGAMFTLRGSAPDGLFAGNSGTNLLIFWQKNTEKILYFKKNAITLRLFPQMLPNVNRAHT